MSEESSSIALQLAVNIRGLVNITKLNTALQELKTNAINVQRSMKAGTGLDALGKQTNDAANGIKNLQRANAGLASNLKAATSGETALAKAITATGTASKTAATQVTGDAKRLAALKGIATALSAREKSITSNLRTESNARNAIATSESKFRANLARKDTASAAAAFKAGEALRARIGRVQKDFDAVYRAGFRLQQVGNDMEQLGRKTIGALQGMATEFGNFEFMVNRASGAMGLSTKSVDGSVNIYQKFQEQIFDTTRELKLFDPTDVAKATYYWASTSGKQVKTLGDMRSVMKSVIPLMKIAALTETSYETAIKGVYSILVQYGKPVSDAADVTAKLHMATQRTAAEFPDLVNSFKMVGPIAKENNMSFEDMLTLFGRLADVGIRGSMSGRAFRQFFIQISKPSKIAKKTLDDLWASTKAFKGQNYLDMVFPQGKFVGVNKYVDYLATALGGLEQAERNHILAQITTANELPVLTALVSKQIDKVKGLGGAWDETKENTDNAVKGFNASWDLLSESWNATVGSFTNGMKILRIQIGGRIAQIFTPILKSISEGMAKISKWFSDANNGPIIDFLVKFVGFTGAILAVGGALTVAAGAMISLGASALSSIRVFKPLFGIIGSFIGVIAGIGAAVFRNLDYIQQVVGEVFANVSAAFADTKGSVKSLTDALGSFASITGPIFDVLIRVIGEAARKISEFLLIISKNQGALGLLTIAAQALGVVLSFRLVKSLTNLIGLGKLFGFGLTGMRLKMMYFGDAIKNTANNATGFARGGKSALGIVKSLGSGLLGFIGPAGIIAAVGLGFSWLYDNVDGFKDKIDALFRDMDRTIADFETHISEVQAEAGTYSSSIMDAINASPEIKAQIDQLALLEKAHKDLQNTVTNNPKSETVWFDNNQLKNWEDDIKNLKANIAGMSSASLDAVKADWEKLGAIGYSESFEKFVTRIGVDIGKTGDSFIIAKDKVIEFAKALSATEKLNASKAIGLMKQFEQGGMRPSDLGAVGNDPTAYNTSQNAIRVLLKDLQDQPIPPEISEMIDEMLTKGTVDGLNAWGGNPDGGDGGPTEEVAKRSFGEISQALISGATTLMDFDKQLEEIMSKKYTPIAAVLTSFLSGAVSKGLKGAEAILHAKQGVLDMTELFKTKLEAKDAAGIDPTNYINKVMGKIKTTFKNGIDKDVTPALAKDMADFVIEVYKAGDKPIPQWLVDKFAERGVGITTSIVEGVETSTATIVPVVEKIPEVVNEALDFGKKPYEAGHSVPTGFVEGFNNGPDPTHPAGQVNTEILGLMNLGTKPYDFAFAAFKEQKAGFLGAPNPSAPAEGVNTQILSLMNLGNQPYTLGYDAFERNEAGYRGAPDPAVPAQGVNTQILALMNLGNKPYNLGYDAFERHKAGLEGAPDPAIPVEAVRTDILALMNLGKKPYTIGLAAFREHRAGFEGAPDPAAPVEGVRKDILGLMNLGGKPKQEGSSASTGFAGGLGNAKAVADARTAANNIASKVRLMNKYGDNAYGWGAHMAKGMANGIFANLGSATDSATAYANRLWDKLGHTTPKSGPLAGDDKWGYHLSDNILGGINKSIPKAEKTAQNFAAAISQANDYAMQGIENGSINIESAARRTIKVEVEVTSPDGSVDRVKASQLERGLMTNDLIMSIEHMAIVG